MPRLGPEGYTVTGVGINVVHSHRIMIPAPPLTLTLTIEETMERKTRKKKPTLISVGNHLIDPNDVACITKVQSKDLYVVRLRSQPNMEYPIWVSGKQISALTNQFNIIVED